MKLLNRILVATDFSPAGHLAVSRAGQLASRHGSDLHLVHGNPLGVLVTEIARHGPQLVAIGRQESERGQSPRESLGTMALRLAYHTPVDVLVVP